MSDAIEIVKDGFRILRNDRSDRVQAHGIPPHLIKRAIELLKSERREEILSKIDKVIKFYERDYKVFFITGMENPNKEAITILMLATLLAKGRLIRYYLAPSFDDHDAGDAAIVGVDQAKGLPLAKIQQFVRDHVGQNRAVILTGKSKDSIERALESDLFDYLAPQAIEVETPAERPDIPAV